MRARLCGVAMIVAWFAAIPFGLSYGDLGFWGALRYSGALALMVAGALLFVAWAMVAIALVALGSES